MIPGNCRAIREAEETVPRCSRSQCWGGGGSSSSVPPHLEGALATRGEGQRPSAREAQVDSKAALQLAKSP